jgi:uncharacterized repeat protein (TIGR03803 family)
MTKQTKITVETDSLLMLRGRNSTRARCPLCNAQSEMVALENLQVISNLERASFEEWINSGELHHLQGDNGSPLICLHAYETPQPSNSTLRKETVMKLRTLASIAPAALFILLATPTRIVAQHDANYTVLHVFKGADGSNPYGSLISDWEGNLYGTTLGGGDTTDTPCQNNPFGPDGCGVIYKIDRGGAESVLYKFKGGPDGAFPASELLLDNADNLYSTARGGGILTTDSPCGFISGCGVVFKLDRDGNESVLYSFKGGSDGFGVASGLVRDVAGNFYGTTVGGGISSAACTGDGPAGSCGVVYKLDPKGNETVLHAFTGSSDGYGPYGTLKSD